jgi:hypothetical protein
VNAYKCTACVFLATVKGFRTMNAYCGYFPSWAQMMSDPAGIRTQDPLLKREMLYQLSYGIKLLEELQK